jgi:hypothetical protein
MQEEMHGRVHTTNKEKKNDRDTKLANKIVIARIHITVYRGRRTRGLWFHYLHENFLLMGKTNLTIHTRPPSSNGRIMQSSKSRNKVI